MCSGRLAPASSARFCFCPLFPRPRSQSALPRRGRGRFIVILCKGLRPLHPRGLNPGGTGGRGRTTCSVGDVLSLLPVATAFRLLSCPLSPHPRSQSDLPRRGRGRFIVILCKGLRPRHPGLNLRGTGLSRGSDCLRWHFPWNRHKRRPNNRFIREKFWGVWGTLSRVPRRFPRFP